MKLLGLLFLLGLIQACDPYNFGFKKNPAYVLNEAFEAVREKNTERLLELSGMEALCVYGNEEGMNYLYNHLNINTKEIEIVPKLMANSVKWNKNPTHVGYWSYYTEVYDVNIIDRASHNQLLKVAIECNYGFEGNKKEEYKEVTKLTKFKKRECRIIKIVPTIFNAIPLNNKCQKLKVNYL